MDTEGTLYLYTPVYRKINNNIICYQIFQDINTKLYHVQSKDCISNGKENLHFFDKQKIELFLEDEPKIREKGYKSIKKAVEKFDDDFE
jgi:hypothetical protein